MRFGRARLPPSRRVVVYREYEYEYRCAEYEYDWFNAEGRERIDTLGVDHDYRFADYEHEHEGLEGEVNASDGPEALGVRHSS